MNKPLHTKIAQYILSTLITLLVNGTIIILARSVIGSFLDNTEDTLKMIMNLISRFFITLSFYIPYFKLFMMPRGKDRLSFELISKNIDIKDFVKTHIKTNWKIDILIYAISGSPILIFGLSSITAIFSPQQLFFYTIINIRIISYLLSLLFFCIAYVLCYVLMYRSLTECSTE